MVWVLGFAVVANLGFLFTAQRWLNAMHDRLNAQGDWLQALHEQVQGQHRDLGNVRNTLLYVGGHSVLEGTCEICDHELRPVGSVPIHEKLRPMFHGIEKAEAYDCGSCRFTYAVIRDVERPEIEPVILCGTRDGGDVEDITWVSDLGLQGKSD